MLALLLIAAIPVVMWIVQTIQLVRLGMPVRFRINARNAPHELRTIGRIVTQVSLLSVIAVYPLLHGQTIPHYYGSLLPPTPALLHFTQGAAASTLFLCTLYLAWLAADRVEVSAHQGRRRWIRRMVLLIPTALFGAFVEEFLFRGVVLADLLRTKSLAPPVAIALGALIFAVAHYVRTVKRRWTFPGHVLLGLLLCIAFVRTNSLWLPAGLHAGGIFMIMGTRPFFRFRGPAWLTGASIFPFAGVVGLLALAALTGFVVQQYPR